jgi:hypothetical protein
LRKIVPAIISMKNGKNTKVIGSPWIGGRIKEVSVIAGKVAGKDSRDTPHEIASARWRAFGCTEESDGDDAMVAVLDPALLFVHREDAFRAVRVQFHGADLE